jgi:hypothetical protein
MKKFILTILLMLSIPAMAQPHHHGHRGGYGHGWGWVAPAIITGVIVYGATRPVLPPPPSVVYAPPPYSYPPMLPPPPIGFHYEQFLDRNCNCYRWVLVQG